MTTEEDPVLTNTIPSPPLHYSALSYRLTYPNQKKSDNTLRNEYIIKNRGKPLEEIIPLSFISNQVMDFNYLKQLNI